MAHLTLTQVPHVKLHNQHQIIHMLKLANLMVLPEQDFGKLVSQLEQDPVFKKYSAPLDKNRKLFSYKRFPGTKASANFLDLNDNVAGVDGVDNLETYLEEKKEIVRLCQKIGVDQFKTYFLYNDSGKSLQEIAHACNLSVDDVKKTMDMVNHVAIQEEFRTHSDNNQRNHQRYSRIAHIERDEKGAFVARYVSLAYARGRYSIDYSRLATLKKENGLSKEEYGAIKKMIKTMELINKRKSTICQIVEKITERQQAFLSSKDTGKMTSLTQVELARELDIHSSTISRAIYGKSVMTPWNEETPLKTFLVKGPVNKIKSLICKFIAEEEEKILEGKYQLPLRDDEIKNLIFNLDNISIATRTVAKYRMELKIPNVYERANQYKQKER